MKCPHCDVGIHESFERTHAFTARDGQNWIASHQVCPECSKSIVYLESSGPTAVGIEMIGARKYLAYPKSASGRPVPPEVPNPYRQDFEEAALVLPLSPKASAALSRRNLQAIIRDKAGIKGKDLNAEIQTLIDSGKVPSYISESLHAVRNIGNFAAHPIKSTSTGEIVEVADGEAEWTLDVLESLLDFYFVEPAKAAKRKADLNKKLKEAGKPLIP